MLHLLQQKKTKITDRMKALWELKDKEKKSWSREEEEEYGRLEEDAKAVQKELSQRMEYQRFLDDEKPQAEKKFERQTKNLSLHNIVRSLLYKSSGDSCFKEDTGKVEEWCREAEIQEGGVKDKIPGSFAIPQKAYTPMRSYKRALTTSDTSGGEAIQDQIQPPTLTNLYAKTVLARIGCQVKEIPSGVGNYKIVKVVDSTANRSSSKAEGASLDIRNLTIEPVYDLEPKRSGRIVEVQNLWLRQSKDPSIVEKTLLSEWASYYDGQSLDGDGTGSNMTGILRDPDLLALEAGANGDALDWSKVIKAVEQIELKNGSDVGLSWIINPQTKRKASDVLRKAASGAKLIYDNGMFADRPVATTTLMPADKTKGSGTNLSQLLLVMPEYVTQVMWGLPTLSLSDKGRDWFEKDQSAFRVQCYANIGLSRPDTSHCLVKDIITT